MFWGNLVHRLGPKVVNNMGTDQVGAFLGEFKLNF